jgi:uncharacterized glyoxalase superfamily protein PhnB
LPTRDAAHRPTFRGGVPGRLQETRRRTQTDALCAEFKAKGVTIARDICEQPYGCRDFDVEDCNGYRLCFGHDIQSIYEGDK